MNLDTVGCNTIYATLDNQFVVSWIVLSVDFLQFMATGTGNIGRKRIIDYTIKISLTIKL